MLKHSTRTILVITMIVLSLGSMPVIPLHAATPTGIIVPLYSNPSSSYWNQIIQAKLSHPSVPIVAIINPSSGPGTALSSSYVTGIQNLQNAGITVLGYVYTHYGGRTSSSAEADISSYNTWYHVNGIMFDEMANSSGFESYYTNLSNYAKSLGMTLTVANPGSSTLSSYIGTVDNITIYEVSGQPSTSTLSSRTFGTPSSFSYVAYGVSSLDTGIELATAPYVQYLYITNDVLSNPYDTVPPYFGAEVAALDTGTTSVIVPTTTNSTTTNSTSTNSTNTNSTLPVPHVTVTVRSADLSGNTLTGLFTTIKQNGTTLSTGYTTKTYTVPLGNTYNVTVANFGSKIFSHWDDNSTTRYHIITPTQNTVLTAYYSIVPVTPSGTSTTVNIYSSINLNSSTTYTYRVSAINSAGTSLPSATANATTQDPITAPIAPTGLQATAISPSQINLSWNTPTNNGGAAISGYKVEASIDGGVTWFTVIIKAP